MPNEKNEERKTIHVDQSLHTVFVDSLFINTRSDGLHLVRFLTALPEGLKEQSRMIILNEDLKRIIDALCKESDYYPAKPKAKPKPKRKTRAKSK